MMLNGMTLRIIEATSWRILAEEETGMPGTGKMLLITPEGGDFPVLKIEELRPKELKS